MSLFNASIAVIAVLAVVLGACLYAVLAQGWRMLRDDGRLRLNQMLRRHGVADGATGVANSRQAAVATRRCIACANKEQCDAWLHSGAHGSIAKFCPNADFVRRTAETR